VPHISHTKATCNYQLANKMGKNMHKIKAISYDKMHIVHNSRMLKSSVNEIKYVVTAKGFSYKE